MLPLVSVVDTGPDVVVEVDAGVEVDTPSVLLVCVLEFDSAIIPITTTIAIIPMLTAMYFPLDRVALLLMLIRVA